MIRIWFNHWFSTVYHLITMIKEANPGRFTVIGTNERSISVYKCATDEWYQEPSDLGDDDYVEYCLTFCREHDVNVFAPRKKLAAISRAASRFEDMGVKLLIDGDYELIKMLDDKAETYRYFKDIIPEQIPEYRIARSYGDFLAMYDELLECSERVCYKLIRDEGARSFRVVDNNIESARALWEKPGSKITLEAAKRVLSQYDFSIPVLMMPFLSGVEVSVDCVATSQGNLIIPRYKTNKRYSEIIFSDELMNACGRIMDTLALKRPMNIQFKAEGDRLYLLEINPRMSGGLQLSCEASGINVPDIAINELLGTPKNWSYPEYSSKKVVHIETPICLE